MVDDVELRPVAEHDRDRVAASDAEPGEAAGERIDAAEQIRPRQRDGVIDGAYGDDVRMVRRGPP